MSLQVTTPHAMDLEQPIQGKKIREKRKNEDSPLPRDKRIAFASERFPKAIVNEGPSFLDDKQITAGFLVESSENIAPFDVTMGTESGEEDGDWELQELGKVLLSLDQDPTRSSNPVSQHLAEDSPLVSPKNSPKKVLGIAARRFAPQYNPIANRSLSFNQPNQMSS